ncbi:MAG: hypothetical protein COY58_09745 [Gammaproteobacteria bacterium CG_4_10_14_0_8_um_filter_38_16]|nr:MAG: hypothetical protein COY58_09745 [Gammaproteobacteria bacterium CG_4_10_14_0_8_um_filter_38_16]PJA03034.1 MAG: hypothetical protein COX72_06920 [Gammaproteobacteria bacterium CG_4_10_14_0_2_um_filter_38_22]PJB10236.1 MAG: hypothetical protein CO120_05995 [Gammaproteobacteria bacterium CG_4_9_14_3_um_filter_38_9]
MFGLGLRPAHYEAIIKTKPAVDYFELLSEDFMHFAGEDFFWMEKICAHYPVSLHGVSLSIGSCDPLNLAYLCALKKLIAHVQPLFVSDHLCWTGVNGVNTHDLLPLPYTEEAIDHLVSRIKITQDYLNRQIMLENVSSYAAFSDAEMSECEFVAEVARRADCFILLDINNVYVNAFNHGFSAESYLEKIPVGRVKQFHLSGHKHCQTHIIDTHDANIVDEVWRLYAIAVKRFGEVALIIERDSDIPPLTALLTELDYARDISMHNCK